MRLLKIKRSDEPYVPLNVYTKCFFKCVGVFASDIIETALEYEVSVFKIKQIVTVPVRVL